MTRGREDGPFFVRFGRPPKGGRSRIGEDYRNLVRWRTGVELPEHEDGVSAYTAQFNEQRRLWEIPTEGASSFLATLDALLSDACHGNLRIYLVRGRVVGEGSDGEPLLADVEIVRELQSAEVYNDQVWDDSSAADDCITPELRRLRADIVKTGKTAPQSIFQWMRRAHPELSPRLVHGRVYVGYQYPELKGKTKYDPPWWTDHAWVRFTTATGKTYDVDRELPEAAVWGDSQAPIFEASSMREETPPEPEKPGVVERLPLLAPVSPRDSGFAHWFGRSKVVEDDRPLVVYHGHREGASFTRFDFNRTIDIGMHFGSREAALEAGGCAKCIRPFYLCIENPLGLADPGDWIKSSRTIRLGSVQGQMQTRGIISEDERHQADAYIGQLQDQYYAWRGQQPPGTDGSASVQFRRYRAQASAYLRRLIESKGYDGIVYSNLVEDGGSTSWVAFRLRQIRHAAEPQSSAARGPVVERMPAEARPSETWYHLTDRPRFALDPRFIPSDNAVAVEYRGGQRGIYLGQDVERWLNGYGYWRPFVAEIAVDPSVRKDPGVHGRYGGELFVPGASFGKLKVTRVIPLDAYAREAYQDFGWVEDDAGQEFDTGAAIPQRGSRAKRRSLASYRYAGPDVRDMPLVDARKYAKQVRDFAKRRRTG